MSILITAVTLWLVSGLIGLGICMISSAIIQFTDDNDYPPTELKDIPLLALMTFIMPLFGPFLLYASLEKIKEVFE